MLKTTRIGIAQHACSTNQDENIERATTGVLECVQQGANIVCLQELVNTIYFCQNEEYEHFDLAQPLDGPLVQHFKSVAKANDVVIIVPFFERRASGVYHNTAVVLDADGSTAGVYRKMHIPDDPGFMEKFYFTPGDLGFKAIPTKFGKVGVMICWDQWFPEGARLTSMAGADYLFYPTAIGWSRKEPELRELYRNAWQTSMRAHAIANGTFVAAANRIGDEGDMAFWGTSFIAGTMGELLAEASDSATQVLVAECNHREKELMRREWPFFRDRRVDAYGAMTKRFNEDD
ncbi:MAG: carbon-nitrogen hydrolase [Myxococcota bacterium]|nr:carbon-nitrogen hydrolase [Myxococcota bacterium]